MAFGILCQDLPTRITPWYQQNLLIPHCDLVYFLLAETNLHQQLFPERLNDLLVKGHWSEHRSYQLLSSVKSRVRGKPRGLLGSTAHLQATDTFKAQGHKGEVEALLVQSVAGKFWSFILMEVASLKKAGSTGPGPSSGIQVCGSCFCSQEPSNAAIKNLKDKDN